MAVRYVFLDGREKECFLPLETPLSLIPVILDPSGNQGIIAIEILSVSP